MTRLLAPIALVGAAGIALAGCSSADPAPSASEGARISVVASTDVYGSVAAAVGGDRVRVTSLIVGTAQDPHEFEASATDQLSVSEADLLVMNGEGYDDYMTQLAGDTDVPVVSAAEVTGLSEEGAGAEHFWYSLEGIQEVAAAIADELTALDPEGADAYADGLAAFDSDVDALLETAAGITDCGDIVMTEPVPGYLLEAAGCTNVTPASFSEAIEEGTGVSVGDLQDVLDLVNGGTLGLLALNTQTEGPEAEQILAAGEAAGVPIVKFSETLPDGEDYVGWMTENLDNVAAALK